ncbi:MAG TPA: PHP domain-containing protein [Longimicrobiales bacterium]
MENVEIARVLNEVADLLELKGENRFRVRAYRNAARTVDGMAEPLAQLVEQGADLTEIPSIGEDIAGYIEELVRTGRLRRLEEARKKVPPSLAELMKVEGIGPKRATRFYHELGVKTVAQLERALERGDVERMPGMGARTAERLLRAVRDYRKHVTRFKLSDADQLVRPLVAYMREAPGIEALDVAGSYRRRRETVGDIDLLAVCEKAAPVMEHFAAYPEVARVDSAGGTRGAVVLRTGLHVDLRILKRESYGAALHYFTGSQAHNIAVRKLGIARGLKINEYGVFRVARGGREEARRAADGGAGAGEAATESARGGVDVDGGERAKTSAGRGRKARAGGAKEVRIAGEREEDVFAAVGMDWVPPELREDRGEVEAALAHELPKLLTLDDIRGDLQMHTEWSDGRDTIEAMARACRDRGYQYVAITDHSRAVTVAHGLDAAALRRQWKEIDRVRRRVRGIEILKGIEVDILEDGSLDLPDEVLEQLDVVVAAIHSHMGQSKAKMTDRIIRAIAHPAVDILAHPTGRIINRREPYAVDIDAVLEAAAEHHVAVELNAYPDRLDLDDAQVHRARELGVKIAIDTDSHSTEHLRYMSYGVDQARRGWLEKKDVLNAMTAKGVRRWLGK